jgi:uncharacterized membrane protein
MESSPHALTLLAGRLHVVAVHFPIALLLLAALLDLAERRRPAESLASTVRVLYRVAAVSAVVAATLGWVHASAEPLGSTAQDLLWNHRWGGTTCAALALVAALGVRSRLVRLVCGLPAAALVALTGHSGGQLVYGEDYFASAFVAAVEPTAVEGTATAPGTPSYANDVKPLFEARCVECHGPRKHKADLRLDRYDEAWFVPGEFLTVIERGSPDSSEMLSRLLLPLDDEDHMPPKDEEQLTAAEIDLVRRWIAAGAKP